MLYHGVFSVRNLPRHAGDEGHCGRRVGVQAVQEDDEEAALPDERVRLERVRCVQQLQVSHNVLHHALLQRCNPPTTQHGHVLVCIYTTSIYGRLDTIELNCGKAHPNMNTIKTSIPVTIYSALRYN